MEKIKYLEDLVSEVNEAGDYEGGSFINDFTELQKEVIAENYGIITSRLTGYFVDAMDLINKKSTKTYKNHDVKTKVSEEDLEDFIIENWDDYFSSYEFVDNQVKCEQGTLDILAKDKTSSRDVIIELKVPTKDKLNRQLLDYATCYNEPILIGVNSSDKNKLDEIIYMDIDVPDSWLDEYNSNAYTDKNKYRIAKKVDKFLLKLASLSKDEIYREVINTETHRLVLLNAYLNGYTNIEGIIDEYLTWTETWFLNRDLNINRIQKMTFREYVDECLEFIMQGFVIKDGNSNKMVNRHDTFKAYKNRYVTLPLESFLLYVNGIDYTGRTIKEKEISYDLIDKDYNIKCYMWSEDTFYLHSDKYRVRSKKVNFKDVHPSFKKEFLINEVMSKPQHTTIEKYFLTIENKKDESDRKKLEEMSIEELDEVYGLA